MFQILLSVICLKSTCYSTIHHYKLAYDNDGNLVPLAISESIPFTIEEQLTAVAQHEVTHLGQITIVGPSYKPYNWWADATAVAREKPDI